VWLASASASTEWPPREPPPLFAVPPTAREIYTPKPYSFRPPLEAGGSSRASSAAGLSASSVGQGTRGGCSSRSGSSQPRHEAAMRKMREFARLQHGAPYTAAQVHAEIEANIQHRKARDKRAPCGFLGPLQLGLGTTRQQRSLPFDKCKGIAAAWKKQSAQVKAIEASKS